MAKCIVRIVLLAVLFAAIALTVTSGTLLAPAYAEIVFSDISVPAGEMVEDPSLPPEPLIAATPAPFIAPLPIDNSIGYKPDPKGYIAEWEYEDPSISVRIVKERANETDYLIAYVQVADASQLRTAMAGNPNSETTLLASTMAKRVNAVLAISGDYYSYRSGGYIVRQGVRHRNKPNKLDHLFIDDQGDLHVVEYATREKVDAFLETLGGKKIINSFAFGPLLVRDGKMVDEIHYFDVGTTKPTQRMGIAQIGPLSYMCVSTEGPEDPGSKGFTVEEFAELMESLGADIAYNLDGGSSNTLVFKNEKINSPKNPKIRHIFDILYFATAIDPNR